METPVAPDPAPEGTPAQQPRLSEELTGLQKRFAEQEQRVTLRAVVQVLHGRAYLLLIILLALPFSVPVPLPGLSTPLGLIIGLISLRLVLGQDPWLPEQVLRWRLPPGFFRQVFVVAARVIRFLEAFLKPRGIGFADAPVVRNLHAVVMLLAAAFLALPLPIPLTNFLPAWVILPIAAGLLVRDGLSILLGYAVAVTSVVVAVFLGEEAHHLIEAIKHWLAG